MKSNLTGSSAPGMEDDGVLGEPASVYKLQGVHRIKWIKGARGMETMSV